MESYKINYTLVTGHGSFKEQVELMSKAGVLLLGHGAAATNTIFQPHRSVLIEVRAQRKACFRHGGGGVWGASRLCAGCITVTVASPTRLR